MTGNRISYNPPTPTILGSTYTPFISKITNINTVAARQCTYIRIGNTCSVSGQCDIKATATGSIVIGIALPVASNFSTSYQAGGAAASTNTTSNFSGTIQANSTSDIVELKYYASDTNVNTVTFSFLYEII
mgnify:CR=1 FL=1